MTTSLARVAPIATLVAALPPFLFFSWPFLLSIFDTNASIDSQWLVLFTYWAIAGFLVGGFGSVWLASIQKKELWLLLLLPSLVDGFYAFAGAVGLGLARMH